MESLLQKRGVRLTLLVLVCAAALYGAYQLSAIFAPLLFSFLVAYVLDPVADALERRKFTRLAAVITIFSVGTLVTVVFLSTAGYFVSSAVNRFYFDVIGDKRYTQEQIDEDIRIRDELLLDYPGDEYAKFFDRNRDGEFDLGYLEQANQYLTSKIEDLDSNRESARPIDVAYVAVVKWIEQKQKQLEESDPAKTEARIQAYLDSLVPAFLRTPREESEGRPPARIPLRNGLDDGSTDVVIDHREPTNDTGLSVFSRLFTWMSWLLLCPLYIFYLLLEIDPLVERVRRFLPGKQRPRIERIVGKIDRTMAAFFRGRLTICVVKGLGTSLGLFLLGVPFAFPLGLAAGFLALVPYVGIWFAIVPSLILAWLDSPSLGYVAAVGGVFALMEVLEGFVLIPKLLGKEVGLHPLTVIVTMLIFAEVLGFVGILLSVPLAAIAKILIEEFVMPLVEEFAAETPDEPAKGTSG